MILDLLSIDAKVARASASLTRGGDLSDHREVAGKTTYDEVAAYKPDLIEGAHQAGILRWIHAFVDTRIGWDLVEEEKEREVAEDPRLENARGPIEIAKTWNEARTALLHAPNVVEREKAITRLGELADPIAAVRRERRSRRFEIAKRLGLAHPWGGLAEPAQTLATEVLDATEPLAKDVVKRMGATPASVLENVLAKDAREGWPARLTSRWFEDAFKTIAPRTPNNVRLPDALGGASFLRAARDWGFALRVGGAAKSLPFALARDPAPTEAFLYGSLLSLAVASRAFAKRKQGISSDAHPRLLARTVFHELRHEAALVRLGRDESVDQDEIDHLGSRLFGHPLPETLGIAWSNGGFSGQARSDAHARFLGAFRAHVLHADLVARYDEDWFDNPRAAQRLGHVTSGPIWQGDPDELKSASSFVAPLVRAFEEAIG